MFDLTSSSLSLEYVQLHPLKWKMDLPAKLIWKTDINPVLSETLCSSINFPAIRHVLLYLLVNYPSEACI